MMSINLEKGPGSRKNSEKKARRRVIEDSRDDWLVLRMSGKCFEKLGCIWGRGQDLYGGGLTGGLVHKLNLTAAAAGSCPASCVGQRRRNGSRLHFLHRTHPPNHTMPFCTLPHHTIQNQTTPYRTTRNNTTLNETTLLQTRHRHMMKPKVISHPAPAA